MSDMLSDALTADSSVIASMSGEVLVQDSWNSAIVDPFLVLYQRSRIASQYSTLNSILLTKG